MVNHRQLDTGGRLLLPEKLSTFWKRQNYRTLVKYLVGETKGQERVLESLACHFSSRQEKEPNLMDALKALVEIAREERELGPQYYALCRGRGTTYLETPYLILTMMPKKTLTGLCLSLRTFDGEEAISMDLSERDWFEYGMMPVWARAMVYLYYGSPRATTARPIDPGNRLFTYQEMFDAFRGSNMEFHWMEAGLRLNHFAIILAEGYPGSLGPWDSSPKAFKYIASLFEQPEPSS